MDADDLARMGGGDGVSGDGGATTARRAIDAQPINEELDASLAQARERARPHRRELIRQIDAALATLAEDRWDPIEENMTLIGAIEKAVRLLDCGRPETARKYLVGALPAGVRDALGFAGGDDAALAVLGEESER